MPEVQFLGTDAGRAATLRPGETLLALSLRCDIPHLNECHGRARCTTCRVRVGHGAEHLPPRDGREAEIARARGWAADVRLACQLVPTADCEVERLIFPESIEAGHWVGLEAGAAVAREAEVAVMFADLVGFSSFTSRHLPYDIIHVLNRLYGVIGQPVLDQRGRIDNYLGDGMLALFEVETSPRETCARVLRAVTRIERDMAAFSASVEEQFGWRPQIRIGLHLGSVVVGEIGHPQARRTTVLGDAVNIACRIEAANKVFGTRVLASREFVAPVEPMVRGRRLPPVLLPGYAEAFELTEIGAFLDFYAAAELHESLRSLEAQGERFCDVFYEELFTQDPTLRRFFVATDLPALKRKLVAALRLIVQHAEDPAPLIAQVRALGGMHAGFGVAATDYEPARRAFLIALAVTLPEPRGADVAVWERVFDAVVETMRSAQEPLEPHADRRT